MLIITGIGMYSPRT